MKRYELIKTDDINLNKKDFLQNKIYSDELLDKLNSYFNSKENKPFYIGIIGSWGSGKTTIVDTALSELDESIKIFSYDAWKYEDDSFRRTFITTIYAQSKTGKNNNQDNLIEEKIMRELYEDYSISSTSLIERIKLSWEKDKEYTSFCSRIIAIISIIGIIFLIICIIVESENKLLDILITLLGTIGFFDILYSQTTYHKTKMFSPEQFYSTFRKILKNTEKEKNVIFIDNLDRCEGENLALALKTLKGFYISNWEKNETKCNKEKQEKIAFVIPLDIDSLNEAYENKAKYYIDKTFDDAIYLKPNNNTDKLDFINEILDENKEIQKIITTSTRNILAQSNIKTPREIIRCLNMFVTEYNLICRKNGSKFINQKQNLDYLMKSIIITKNYPKLTELIYSDIEQYMKYEKIPLAPDFQKDFVEEYGQDCFDFLKITKIIKPTDYLEFYFKQKGKKYNLPEKIEKSILTSDINSIKNSTFNSKDIKQYFINTIFYDINNNLWDLNILNKFNCLIYLDKENYFDDEEIKEIVDRYDELLFENSKFYNNVVFSRNILFEDLIYFANRFGDKIKFKNKLLEGIVDNLFGYEQDDYRVNANKILTEIEYEFYDKSTQDFIDYYIQMLTNTDSYKTLDCSRLLNNKIINLIKSETITNLTNKLNSSNIDLFYSVLNGLTTYNHSYDISICDAVINFYNRYGHRDLRLELLIKIYNYLSLYNEENNWKTLIEKLNLSFDFKEFECKEFINGFITLSIKNDVYNNYFQSFLNRFKQEDNINEIFNVFSKYESKTNDKYINLFLDYLNLQSQNIIDKNKTYIIKFYINNKFIRNDIIKTLKNKTMLNSFCLELEDDMIKNEFAEMAVKLFVDKNSKFANIFLYELNDELYNQLVETYGSFDDIISIIKITTKESCKEIAYNKLIKNIENRSKLFDQDFNKLMMLLRDSALPKNKIKFIIENIITKVSMQHLKKILDEGITTDKKVIKMLEERIEPLNSVSKK